MSHVDAVDHLRALVTMSGDASVVELAIVNLLEDLAMAVDLLEAEHRPPPEERERGLGSI
jgi:hypothetical protein